MTLTLKNTMKDQKVKAKDVVVVYGTGNDRFIPKNMKTTVHRIVADKLLATGAVSLTKVEDGVPEISSENKGNFNPDNKNTGGLKPDNKGKTGKNV